MRLTTSTRLVATRVVIPNPAPVCGDGGEGSVFSTPQPSPRLGILHTSHTHRPVHVKLQPGQLERFHLGVGEVVDKYLTCRLLVIWEPVSENPVYQMG